jgi:hypothetical protein
VSTRAYTRAEPSTTASNNASDAARDAIAPAAPWIERLARVGFAAKALLYGIVGVLAFRAAFSDGGATIGSRGALASLVRQPYGAIVLVVMAVGLFGYAAWRIIEAVVDPERRGTSLKGIAVRLGYAGRGVIHAWLGVEAIRLAVGAGGGSGSDGTEHWTARALDAPLGSWLVIAAGLGVIGYGLYQVYRAWKAKLSKQLNLSRLSSEAGSWLIKVSRFGLGARGVVFGVIGAYLVRAGAAHNANKAADTGEALSAIGQQPLGNWLLAIVATGLIAYGAYDVVQARYRVIRPT